MSALIQQLMVGQSEEETCMSVTYVDKVTLKGNWEGAPKSEQLSVGHNKTSAEETLLNDSGR